MKTLGEEFAETFKIYQALENARNEERDRILRIIQKYLEYVADGEEHAIVFYETIARVAMKEISER